MTCSKRPIRRFRASSQSGALGPPRPVFSTEFKKGPTGRETPVCDQEVVTAAFSILSRRLERATALESPRAVRDYLTIRFAGHEHEVFSCIYLDNRHRIIAVEELFRGTVDGASVHPREVVKRALTHNAAAIILTHNHPSGIAEPSQADELITLRLRDALALVDIRVLDHLIVGGARTMSLAERGLI
jgi:DNA repair protein RadC